LNPQELRVRVRSQRKILKDMLKKNNVKNWDINPEEYVVNEVMYYQQPRQGRLSPIGSRGLTTIARTIRWTLAEGIYEDIDISNAHPNFLAQYIQKYPKQLSPNPSLDEYVNNRENILKKVMKELDCDRGKAKQQLLRLMNGGGNHYDILKYSDDSFFSLVF